MKTWGTTCRDSKFIVTNLDSLNGEDDDLVIIMIGTNDRISTNASLNECRNMSSLPASLTNESASRTYNYHMEDVDTSIMDVSSELNQEYVSLFKGVQQYCEFTNTTLDSILSDGLHPYDNGYKIMFNILLDELWICRKLTGSSW